MKMVVANESRIEEDILSIPELFDTEAKRRSRFAEHETSAFQRAAGTQSQLGVLLEGFAGLDFGGPVKYVRSISSDAACGGTVVLPIPSVSPYREDYPSPRDSSLDRSASERFMLALVDQISIRFSFQAVEPQLGETMVFPIIQVPRIEIYPGFSVTKDEYRRRFEGVDLVYFRQNMKPEMFRSFVKSMGTVKGVRSLSERGLEEYEE